MTQPGEDLHEDDPPGAVSSDPEAPEADALEQAIPVGPFEQGPPDGSLGLEVDEADALEQRKVVDLDEDYR